MLQNTSRGGNCRGEVIEHQPYMEYLNNFRPALLILPSLRVHPKSLASYSYSFTLLGPCTHRSCQCLVFEPKFCFALAASALTSLTLDHVLHSVPSPTSGSKPFRPTEIPPNYSAKPSLPFPGRCPSLESFVAGCGLVIVRLVSYG